VIKKASDFFQVWMHSDGTYRIVDSHRDYIGEIAETMNLEELKKFGLTVEDARKIAENWDVESSERELPDYIWRKIMHNDNYRLGLYDRNRIYIETVEYSDRLLRLFQRNMPEEMYRAKTVIWDNIDSNEPPIEVSFDRFMDARNLDELTGRSNEDMPEYHQIITQYHEGRKKKSCQSVESIALAIISLAEQLLAGASPDSVADEIVNVVDSIGVWQGETSDIDRYFVDIDSESGSISKYDYLKSRLYWHDGKGPVQVKDFYRYLEPEDLSGDMLRHDVVALTTYETLMEEGEVLTPEIVELLLSFMKENPYVLGVPSVA